MARIALTGGIAAGKSFVADELAALGATIIDSDVLARQVVEPGTPGLAAVSRQFGQGVLTSDGRLDREALAAIVFSDAAARAQLNAIVHPLVRLRAEELEAAAAPGAVVVQVIPLLVETGLDHGFGEVIVVDVPVAEQLARLRARNGFSEAEALARIEAQATRERRLSAATRVIDNSGTQEQTRAQVRQLWDRLRRRAG